MRAENHSGALVACLLAVAVLFGCTPVWDQMKINKFTETSESYGKALLWGHFEAANLYRKPDIAREEKPDLEKLKNIKVAQYDIRDLNVSEDYLRVEQEAEITYFQLDKMILKTLRDQQVWEYDTVDRRWYLTTRLPEFP